MRAGSSLWVIPSGLKIRSSKASDADIPVSFSINTPSSTMLVLLYSYCVPGAKFGLWERPIFSNCAGVQAFFGCLSSVALKAGSKV